MKKVLRMLGIGAALSIYGNALANPPKHNSEKSIEHDLLKFYTTHCLTLQEGDVFADTAKRINDRNHRSHNIDTMVDDVFSKTNLYEFQKKYQIKCKRQEKLKQRLERIYRTYCFNFNDGIVFVNTAIEVHDETLRRKIFRILGKSGPINTYKGNFIKFICDFSFNGPFILKPKEPVEEKLQNDLKQVYDKFTCDDLMNGVSFVDTAMEVLIDITKKNLEKEVDDYQNRYDVDLSFGSSYLTD